MFTPVYSVRHYVYETEDGSRQPKLVTDSYMEAESWYEDGFIVYEVHTAKFATDWINSMNQTFYEWH
jgi:hypothetical protein